MLAGMLSDGVRVVGAGGVEHWVRVAGAHHGGVPLVMLHGGPGESCYSVEQSVGDELAKVSTVIFYDQRGCGRSAKPSEPDTYTMTRLVADLEEIRSALGLDRIIPWGVSFGCQLAAEYAVAHPNNVERLVLHAPPVVGPLHPGLWSLRPNAVDTLLAPAERAELRTQLDSLTDPIQRTLTAIGAISSSEHAARFFYHDPANMPEPDPAAPEMNLEMALALVGTERPDLADDLTAITIPTLVMIGLWDRHVGFDMARDLADRMPGSVVRIFDRSGHLIDEEQPAEYVEVISTFIRDTAN